MPQLETEEGRSFQLYTGSSVFDARWKIKSASWCFFRSCCTPTPKSRTRYNQSLRITNMGPLGLYLEKYQGNSCCSFHRKVLLHIILPGNHVLEITIEAVPAWPQLVFFWNVLLSSWSRILSLVNWSPQILRGSILGHAFQIRVLQGTGGPSTCDTLCQGTLLVVTKKDGMSPGKFGWDIYILSLITRQLYLVKHLEVQKILIREDGYPKRSASFCNLM